MIEPLPSKPGSVSEPMLPVSLYLLPRPRHNSGQSRKIHPQKNKSKTREQTLLCYVTAFVACLTHRSVLLQTVAALFPLRGTIHRTGRDTGASLAGVRATDRWMQRKQKKLTNSHRRATLCHLQSRCLSGFLMAKVADAAASRT